jgi:hypothetical protein
VVDLFACNDRVVRVGLLERIQKLSKASLSDVSLNACFDQITLGFGDSTPKIRELTIKAMMPLAPRLTEQNRNDKLLRHIAKLQGNFFCIFYLGLIVFDSFDDVQIYIMEFHVTAMISNIIFFYDGEMTFLL